eukprot:2618355-Rhodomonas_salina.4
MPGTDIGTSGPRSSLSYSRPSKTSRQYGCISITWKITWEMSEASGYPPSIVLRVRYAMSGTDMATRLPGSPIDSL